LATNFETQIESLNQALYTLDAQASVENGLTVGLAVVAIIGGTSSLKSSDIIDAGLLKLPNSERQDPWFHQHPWMRGERSAFEILNSKTTALQAKFYWLKKKSNAFVAGSVHFTKNWEDHDFTRTDEFQIGIDFFLTPDSSSVLVVLSNRGKLRVLELSRRITNTQLEIFQRWFGLKGVQERAVLHDVLWNSFRLQSVNSRFYEGVSNAFNELLSSLRRQGRDEESAKLFASRLMGRLIFIWFLRKMNLVSDSVNYFDANQDDQGHYYREKLERLFFRTLDKPLDERDEELTGQVDLETPYLNGGLFSPRADDWVGDKSLSFPPSFFPGVFEHFDNFNFTTDESTPEYEQVAIDPEMLGRVFESLLASQLAVTGEQARKAKGAFYTPREIVAYMCKEAVRGHLESLKKDDARFQAAIVKLLDTSDQDWAIAGTNSLRDIPTDIRALLLESLKILKTFDPACGSGAFPLGLLQLLSKLQLRLDPRLDHYKLKLSILQNNIFGSDIEPMAVEISRLRSWLSLIVEEQNSRIVAPLPNLEFNFVSANSLLPIENEHIFTDHAFQVQLQTLRQAYFSATKPKQKNKIQAQYLRLTSPDLLDDVDPRSKQLKSFNPFDSDQVATFFDADTMFGIQGGFDIVLGNPPYIGLKGHVDIFEPVKQSDLGRRFFSGKMDYFYFFFHLGLDNLKVGGILAFITTNYFVTATYAKKLIGDIQSRSIVREFINFNEMKIFESAAGQHNMISILQRGSDESFFARTTVVAGSISGKAEPAQVIAVLERGEPNAEYLTMHQSDLFDGDKIRLDKSGNTGLEAVLDSMAASGVRIENVAKVRQGIISGADKVTQAHVERLGANSGLVGKGIFILSKDEVEALELDENELQIVMPHFKNSDIYRYGAKSEASEFVIFADKRISALEGRPKLQEHLDQFDHFLQGEGSTFPNLHRPRRIDYEGEKIIVSKRALDNRFGYSSGAWYGSSDINFIESSNELMPTMALLAILNSSFYFAWFYKRGKRKGKMLELFQVPLSEAPAPALSKDNIELIQGLVPLVEKIISMSKDGASQATAELESLIDLIVGDIFGFTNEQTEMVASWARMQKMSLIDEGQDVA